MSNFTEVERSVSGNCWKFRECDERQVQALSQRFGVSQIMAKVLSARGVEVDTADSYLKPTLKNLLPDPLHYKDMNQAAERLAKAVMGGEKIGIFGDYDVDGATASSLLKRYFNMAGTEAIIHIPNRIEEGYGPNETAIQGLWNNGARILVTVDCGTVSYEPLAAARRIGFDTIVVDHHIGGVNLPEAHSVINPNRLDEDTPHNYMAAVGVSFMLTVAVNTKLRELGYFNNHQEPNIMNLLDLVALGTICDVMPLMGANRAFVSQGLKVLASRTNVGLAALADVAQLSEKPGVFHLGFLLGPRINAGGRIGEASLGARLLTTSDPSEARQIAETLNKLNEERRTLESLVEEEATKIAEADGVDTPLIMPVGHGWHQGVVGIVASRLKERYYRPTAVVTINDGVAKASSRSITGVDLGGAIASARDMGLLLTGGGHAMAAGFTFLPEKLDELKAFLVERLRDPVAANCQKLLKLDSAIALSAVNLQLAHELEVAAPYGTGNAEPRFVISNVRIAVAEQVGASHVRCILDDGITTNRIYSMAFRALENPLGQFLLKSGGKKVHLAVRLRLSNWQGRERIDVQIDDASET